MNRFNLSALLLTAIFSTQIASTAAAQEEPTPEPNPTVKKTEVVCGASASFYSAQFGAARDTNSGNVFKLKPAPDSADKRAVTSGVVTLERGHEFAFNLTWIPRGSNLVRGEDLMNATVRYQRRDGNTVKVLAESVLTSDQITNFGELQSRRSELPVAGRFNNPEVSTIRANKSGQLPDGITTNANFDCVMTVGSSQEL